MPDEHKGITVLAEIFEFARSGVAADEFLRFFTARATAFLHTERVELRPVAGNGPARRRVEGRPLEDHAWHFPVHVGTVHHIDLHVTPSDDPLRAADLERCQLLAEVLGACLLALRAKDGPWAFAGGPDAPGVAEHPPRSDDMVDVVMDCAHALDRIPGASTRSRLALVVRRFAATVGAPHWSIALAHADTLYDVSNGLSADSPDTFPEEGSPAALPTPLREPVPLSAFPARRRASDGGAYFADRSRGDDAERRMLTAHGLWAVMGAGGYDLDGRSWVVQVFPDTCADLENVTAVLAALVQAGLSFPREATVPRPEEQEVGAILRGAAPVA